MNKTFLMMDAFSGKVKRGVGLTREVKDELKTTYSFKKAIQLTVSRLKESKSVFQLKQ